MVIHNNMNELFYLFTWIKGRLIYKHYELFRNEMVNLVE